MLLDVVCVCGQASVPSNAEVLHIAIKDEEQEDLLRHLPQCLEFIHNARKQGGTLIVLALVIYLSIYLSF